MSCLDEVEQQLIAKKQELNERLERITENHRRLVDANSKERAQQTENYEVVDSLGNEAREELAEVTDALDRMSSGGFGVCVDCGRDVGKQRLMAQPYAGRCIECANLQEVGGAQE